MSPRRSIRRRRQRRIRLAVLLVTAGLAFAAGFLIGRRHEPGAPAPGPPAEAAVERAPAPEAGPPAPAPYPDGTGARIALVIDDLGRDPRVPGRLGRWGIPVSAAVLPFEVRSAEVAEELRRLGIETLCHLPLEGGDGADPGPGALSRDMGRRRLRAGARRALAAVPGASGVNNHMGSGFSADREAMRAVLEEIAAAGLFFLDSRTGPESVGYRLALEMGIPAAERQVFLDGDPGAAAIRRQFALLLEAGRRRGAAIGIGHPRSETLAVLEEEIPPARAAGYEFVPVSYLLDRPEVLPL